MVVGHVAIVAGVLMSASNASTFEGVTADYQSKPAARPPPSNMLPQRRGSAVESVREWSRSSVARRRIVLPPALKGYFYRPVSSSQYNTAWMWNRGTNKMLWIARMCDEDPSLVLLRRRVLRLGADGWLLSTTLPTAFLYVMPTFLAGMTR
jgi:hypothetical protein